MIGQENRQIHPSRAWRVITAITSSELLHGPNSFEWLKENRVGLLEKLSLSFSSDSFSDHEFGDRKAAIRTRKRFERYWHERFKKAGLSPSVV